MPAKKKTPMPKSVDKRNMPDLSSSPAGSHAGSQAGNRNGQGGKAVPAKAGAAVTPAPARMQMEAFEEGMRLFHTHDFERAKGFFERAATGPDRAVTHRAGLHARMCGQRLESWGPVLNTPDEHYNYAITLINSRDLAGAQKHLRSALAGDAAADHVLYALAACQSLGGDLQAAYENLRRAIELQPRNRLAARQDPDFAAMAEHPAFVRLLHPDKKI